MKSVGPPVAWLVLGSDSNAPITGHCKEPSWTSFEIIQMVVHMNHRVQRLHGMVFEMPQVVLRSDYILGRETPPGTGVIPYDDLYPRYYPHTVTQLVVPSLQLLTPPADDEGENEA